MDNFKTHEEKSLPSSNPKRLRSISYFPCTTSKHFKKTIYEGIERNSHEDQFLVDIFYDAEENVPIFDETNFEDESSSSQLKQSYCAICTDYKPIEEMFENQKCSHSFCKDCVGSYLTTKIQENIALVKCPDSKCNDILEPYDCISIIPKDVFERWENALVVLGSQIFYCPFNDCSAMLVNDGEDVMTVSECPNCDRLFCAQCKVSWHAEVDCREFQRKDVVTVLKCPNCDRLLCAQCKVSRHAGVDCREFQHGGVDCREFQSDDTLSLRNFYYKFMNFWSSKLSHTVKRAEKYDKVKQERNHDTISRTVSRSKNMSQS